MVWDNWRVIYVLWTKDLDRKEKSRQSPPPPQLRKINHSQDNVPEILWLTKEQILFSRLLH